MRTSTIDRLSKNREEEEENDRVSTLFHLQNSRTFQDFSKNNSRTFPGLKVKVSTYKNHVPSTQQCYNSLLYALIIFVTFHHKGAFNPGARSRGLLKGPGEVQGHAPGGGRGGEAPQSSWVSTALKPFGALLRFKFDLGMWHLELKNM